MTDDIVKCNRVKILTSLPLQMALHYHISFAPFWIISKLACLIVKVSHLTITDKVVVTTIQFIGIIIEPIRLYLGYYGNIGEKVPPLSGFWIISLILQLPIAIFLCFSPRTFALPLERCVCTLHIAFLAVEIIYGFAVIRSIAGNQMLKARQRLRGQTFETVKRN